MNASERYGGDRSIKVDIAFNEDRCMHRKSVFAQCGPCVDACPSHAIHAVDGSAVPAFDGALCLHCGTCLAACPFEAFHAENFSERKMLKRMAGSGPVRVRCWLPQGELSALHSPLDSYQAAVCLAALTPAALFAMARDRPCVLATGRCESCALYRTVGPVLRRTMRRARALLGDWGRAANLIDEGGIAFPSAPLPHGSAGEEAPRPDGSRSAARSLFQRWHAPEEEAAAEVEDDLEAEIAPRSVKRHAIDWRGRLASLWAEADPGQTAGGAYPWPAQVVDASRCEACGTCISMCPTGAIRLRSDDGAVAYTFNAGLCSECGLCARSCPQGALTRSHETLDSPFDVRECYRRLREGAPDAKAAAGSSKGAGAVPAATEGDADA